MDLNILDFGADPTGVCDSTAAIRAAQKLLLENPGPHLLDFPAGKYLVRYDDEATIRFQVPHTTYRMADHVPGGPACPTKFVTFGEPTKYGYAIDAEGVSGLGFDGMDIRLIDSSPQPDNGTPAMNHPHERLPFQTDGEGGWRPMGR